MSFRCQICCGPTLVIDSRWHAATETVRRRRKCRLCNLRQSTHETVRRPMFSLPTVQLEMATPVVEISQSPSEIIYRAKHPRVRAALKSACRNRTKDRINHLRNQLEQLIDSGLGIQEIAQRAGISQSTLYNFLSLRTSDKNLSRTTERRLVKAFSGFVPYRHNKS
mgnify:CR=1 FL=1